MANKSTIPSCCPNKTEESKITHAAIASWGGFVYQGLCALCVAVEWILKEGAQVQGWYLNVEGYEDCAILDDTKQIVSLHQAKCYKVETDFTKEFMKMEDKRSYWHEKGKCQDSIPLYFHCNQPQNYSHNVVEYKYCDDSASKSHEDVREHLMTLVEQYTDKYNVPGSSIVKADRLIALISDHVTMLDELTKEHNKDDMQGISVEKSIPFSIIMDNLNDSNDRMTVVERVRASVVYLRVWLEQFKFNYPETDYTKVDQFVVALERKSVEEKEKVIRKLFPDVNLDLGLCTFSEITNSDRFGFLRNIILEANQMNDNDTQWSVSDGLAHPSTLGRSKSANEHCRNILRNSNSASELLRDYRWIVGDNADEVDDIRINANVITSHDADEHNRITKIRKVGLTDAKGINNRMV